MRSTESLGRLLKNGPFRLFYNQGCPAVKKKYHNQYKIQRRYSTLNPHNVTFTKNWSLMGILCMGCGACFHPYAGTGLIPAWLRGKARYGDQASCTPVVSPPKIIASCYTIIMSEPRRTSLTRLRQIRYPGSSNITYCPGSGSGESVCEAIEKLIPRLCLRLTNTTANTTLNFPCKNLEGGAEKIQLHKVHKIEFRQECARTTNILLHSSQSIKIEFRQEYVS